MIVTIHLNCEVRPAELKVLLKVKTWRNTADKRTGGGVFALPSLSTSKHNTASRVSDGKNAQAFRQKSKIVFIFFQLQPVEFL